MTSSFLDFKIPENDDRTFFVAWIGNVHHHITFGSAQIDVLYYPLWDGINGKFNGDIKQLDLKKRMETSIDVGLLAAISSGQLIKKNRIIKQPEKYLEKKKLRIALSSPESLSVRPIKDFAIRTTERTNEAGKKYPIYEMDFPLVKNQNSKCICLDKSIHSLEGFDYVVIPCTELLRFYFCTSEKIPQALFTGGLHDGKNELYDISSIIPKAQLADEQIPYVELELKMVESDAVTIGRIAYSQEALHSARTIYNVIREESVNEKLINPVCYFPFSGISDLHVCGKEIKAVGKDKEFEGKKVFLVYSILTCSGEFPFKELDFIRKYDNQQGENKNDENLKKTGWNSNNGKSTEGHDVKITSDEPSNHNGKRVTVSELGVRFTKLPTARKVKKDIQEYRSERGLPKPEEPNVYTTNPEPANNPGVGKVSIQIVQAPPVGQKPLEKKTNTIRTTHSPDKYELYFKDVVTRFSKVEKLTIEYLSNDGSGYLYLDPLVHAKSSEEFKWSCEGFDRKKDGWYGDGWYGRRPVLAARLINPTNKKEFLLFDWIKRKSESSGGQIFLLYREDFETVPIKKIDEVLVTCSSNARIWLHENQLKDYFHREPFDHLIKRGIDAVYKPMSLYLTSLGF